MAIQVIRIEICERCLDADGECHNRWCAFWQVTPLTADQAAALDRQRQINPPTEVTEWLDESG